MLIELDPVDRITTGAEGSPGQRVFYLQGRRGNDLITVLVEKQQVELLAAWVVDVLYRLGRETAEGPTEEEMGLEQPVDPRWRVGRLSLGYDENRDMMFLEVEELTAEDAEEESAAAEERGVVRFWATREQMLALARHGAAVAAAGRPRCELCGNPIDPEGHDCPALDGHGEIGG